MVAVWLTRPDQAFGIAIEGLCPTEADPWVAQAYLPGEEISAYAVAVDGRLAAFQSYRPTYRVGHGAGVAFEAADAPVARHLPTGGLSIEWTGQFRSIFVATSTVNCTLLNATRAPPAGSTISDPEMISLDPFLKDAPYRPRRRRR